MQQAIDELTPDHKAVILLREVEGLSYEDISRVMQCSKGTVMSRLHYARKKLQDKLKDVEKKLADIRNQGQGQGAQAILTADQPRSTMRSRNVSIARICPTRCSTSRWRSFISALRIQAKADRRP